MADGGGLAEAATAAASPPAPAPGLSPPRGWRERLRARLAGTGVSLWFVVGLGLGLLYALRVPLRLCENFAAGERPRLFRGRARGPGEVPGARAKGQRFRVPGGLRRRSRWGAAEWVFFSGRSPAADCQTLAAAAGPSLQLGPALSLLSSFARGHATRRAAGFRR